MLKLALTQDAVPHTLVTRLTHHHSIYSPYFDPKRSTKDLADIDLKSSIYRASYLTANTSTLFHLTDIESQLTPGEQNGFLAHLQVGSKHIEQLVYMDTGSSLLWINCEPCGFNVPGPLFHPMESSSYEIEDCDSSEICDATGAVKIRCDDDYDGCTFNVRYGSSGYSQGHLARETFKFGRSRETLKNIIFGCSERTSLYVNGILGLGNNRLSLIAQRHSSKFSYCIGNISDRSYAYNTLVIGDKIELLGYETPMISEDKYYITLEGIKIGDKPLDIDPQIFKRTSDYNGGMVVDTGSTYSFIPEVVLKKFEAEIINLIDFLVARNYSITYEGYTRLCYNGVLNRDLSGFPAVELQFQGEASMELTAENIFQQIYDENFCLAILPSEILQTSVSILGNLMQQYFYVAYDLRGMKLAFQRMECNTVDDYIHDEL
ncbi:hypothetical protein Pfo_000860 [Paulownia fortunei]|nr:hypothetical protein Pfo_000860 [Paulownia fortunei]